MSTNYYLTQPCTDACAHCGAEPLHIGKRSSGWSFTFQAHEDIRSRAQWEETIAASDGVIVDEYGTEKTLDELREIIDSTRGGHTEKTVGITVFGSERHFTDPEGWDFLNVDFC